MIVLGMSGKMGVGKNYISDTIVVPTLLDMFATKGYTLIPYYYSFGSFIKTHIYARDTTDSLSFENMFIRKTPEVRSTLQSYGTDIVRNTIRDDVWIRELDMWMRIQVHQLNQLPAKHSQNMIPLFVIQDIRFQNEYEFVRKMQNSLVIRVEAPSRNKDRVLSEIANEHHVSETDLDMAFFEHVLQNDPCDDDVHTLEKSVKNILAIFCSKINLKIYEDK